MLVFLGFSLLLTSLIQTFVLPNSALTPSSAHSWCAQSCPISEHASLYRSLVCGSSISSAEIRSDFVQTGLVHLLVVSGQHFLFLEWAVDRLTRPLPSIFKWAIGLVVMGAFTLTTGGTPPATRAAASWFSRRASDHLKLGWSPLQIIVGSTLYTGFHCRSSSEWVSLALSSTAAALIALGGRTPRSRTSLTNLVRAAASTQLRLYLGLLPALSSIHVPHPLSILWNLTAGAFIGNVLFPLSLSSFLVPSLVPSTDRIWSATLGLVDRLAAWTPRFVEKIGLPVVIPLAYSLLVVGLAFVWERKRRTVTLALVCCVTAISAEASDELVIWNVGQGSWATVVEERTCRHFDMGGEFAPWTMIREACEGRTNTAHFSHWDWDHVSFASEADRRFDVCLFARPGGSPRPSRQRLLESLTPCEPVSGSGIVEHVPRRRGKGTNSESRIFSLKGILFTGDATRTEEREIPRLHRHRILILSHHGSKTSTSAELLDRVRPLLAIASARRAKYGHPHDDVVRRLKERGVALLRTEDWGSIRIEIRDCKGGTPC